jgi:hypothetical protein
MPTTPIMHRGAEHVRIAVAATAWGGLLLQLWLSLGLANANGKPVSAGIVAYFGYFTIITNFFVALVFTVPSVGLNSQLVAWLRRRSVAGCAVTSILLVGIAYHFLLRDFWKPQGTQWLADIILHYVVPAGALVHWSIKQHESPLPWSMPARWCSYPFIYLGYAMLRGEIIDTYPYPFIDVTILGYARAILNALALITGFLALGYLVAAISRRRITII